MKFLPMAHRLAALVGLGLSGMLSAAPPALPEPRANNVLARVVTEDAILWFSGLGIGPGKTWRDLHADGWLFREHHDQDWQAVAPLPAFEGLAGRLGSHAVSIDDQVFVIGGYTVAKNHTERSTPGIYRLQPEDPPAWQRATTMPVPIDDAVALVHRDRHLYLVSGWSDTGNVNLVQIWDQRSEDWQQGEPWPGAPVFGHAGGLIAGRMVICGGAKIVYPADGQRDFVASDECWLGTIREDDPRRLDWKPLPPMPGGSRYRAGAIAVKAFDAARVIFAGGAVRPYNYDGQGYDGLPATALDTVVGFNLDSGRWQCHGRMPAPRMDHRSMVYTDKALVLVGGMDADRAVVAGSLSWPLDPPRDCNVKPETPTRDRPRDRLDAETQG